MKDNVSSDYMMSSSRRCLPLERTFVLLLVASGVLLLFIASTQIHESQYELMRQYLAVKKAYIGRHSRDMAETEAIINNLVRNCSRSISGINGSSDVTTTPPRPVTDPPWINSTASPVTPFVTGKQKHPFLRGYVIENTDVCRNASLDVLIVIHSAVLNFQKRRVLRETWAATETLQGISVRRIFLLGRNATGVGSQVRVNTEQATYGDIVQGDFIDSYFNLTLKAVMALRWVNDHCSHARFVLKADDDVFVDVFRLMENFLQRLASQKRTVMCHSKEGNKTAIVRDPRSQWYVPKTVLPNRTYWPPFCSGYLVVMTTDVIPGLYKATFRTPYVPVDDGFVYGVLPAFAGDHFLHYMNITQNLTLSSTVLNSDFSKQPRTLLGGMGSNEENIVKLWQAALGNLSPWAKKRASIVGLQSTMAPKSL